MSSHWFSSPQTWRRVLGRRGLAVGAAPQPTGGGTASVLRGCWRTLPPLPAAAWNSQFTELTPLTKAARLYLHKKTHHSCIYFMSCTAACWETVVEFSPGSEGAGKDGLTFLPRPSHPGSVSVVLAGTPPSSTWSTGLAMRRCHSNHIPFCTASPTGQRVSPAAPSADS